MGSKVIVQMNGAKTTLLDPSGSVQPKEFTFDFSYWSFDAAAPNFATNPKVYSDLGVSVLNNAWLGFNCCLFAYGQTGSGKSYSMVRGGTNTARQRTIKRPFLAFSCSRQPAAAAAGSAESTGSLIACPPCCCLLVFAFARRLDTERTRFVLQPVAACEGNGTGRPLQDAV